ncbi:MAG: glycosyltransferase [Clostridium sp.]|nr:glycosyltransferase [Clostridium sp.]
MKPKLYLITKNFPYGHGEDSFVKPEYPYLCREFDVTIITAELGEPIEKKFLNEASAAIIPATQGIFEKLFSLFCFLCEKDSYIEIKNILKTKTKVFRRIYRALMFGTAAETFYCRLKKIIGLNKDTKALFYFYWFDYKCFGLTMHKDRYPYVKIVARAHGYELFDERELYGKQFFKPQMDDKLQRLIFAAQYGKEYYLSRYQKRDGDKYPLHRLGVPSKKVTCAQRREHFEKEIFLLLSCARMVDIKRINLIIDGLSAIDGCNIKWVHIGDGDEMDYLQGYAKQKLGGKINIEYEFMGMMPNEQVVQYYFENYVSCFITTTQTEGGSPVSVQEALSFGVPIISTSVGELLQMVDDNGILLSKNPPAEEIGQAIEKIFDIYGKEEYFLMCQASLTIFEKKFNAQNNFEKFAYELKMLDNSEGTI